MSILQRIFKFLKYKLIVFNTKRRYLKVLKTIQNQIFIDGHPDSKNFGDALNIFIVKYLTDKNVFPSKYLTNKYSKTQSYSVIGSICQWSRPNSIIWGSGFISSQYHTNEFVKPYQVNAVRGPLTREIYLKNNIECPEIYGDPALLMPLLYNPKIDQVYEYGIIPHYTDKHNEWIKNQIDNKVLLIDIEVYDDYEKFVYELKSCKKIITSSLHGLILAHAYGIPVCWVSFSENITGGDFKFKDYFASIKRDFQPAIKINSEINLDHLSYDSNPLSFDLKPLIESCPFIKEEKKNFLISQL